jgi:hypothetical protein
MKAFRRLLSLATAAIAFALLASPAPSNGGARRPRPHAMVLTIGGPAHVHPIAPGFLGLSFEYFALPSYAGTNPEAVNPVLIQLIRNLADGHPPVLRIGGDTTDQTWWPVPGVSRPAGVNYALTPDWMQITRSLATRLGARLILGINLEADSPTIAAAEANALVADVGRRSIEALELGNEPELYGAFKWGNSGVLGRPKGYDFAGVERDYSRVTRALPNVPLAGPTVGWHPWFRDLGGFLSDQPRVAIATLHRYPLQFCGASPRQAIYPTLSHLLAATASRSLARSVAAAVATAHAHHVPLRVDEMNSVSCGDTMAPELTESFASALWALDTLFEMARVGVDGVNIHGYPGATYALFTFRESGGAWSAVVAPDYYGLDMFAQAVPPGSRLLTVASAPAGPFHVWAVRAPNRTIRVVLINKGTQARVAALRVPAASGHGLLVRLEAAGLEARGGVTLAGQSYGPATSTGLLAGPRVTASVKPTRGEYVVRIPAASAAMLTLAPG